MSRGRWEDYDHSDQEMDVYEQCCDNCTNCQCPMMLPEMAEEQYEEYGTLEDSDEGGAENEINEAIKRCREDAVIRREKLAWCIYWKGRGGW